MSDMNTEIAACREVQAKLDFYVDNELITEMNHDVREHLEQCATCARDAEVRRELRARLQTTVRQSPVPGDLERRIRERIRESLRPSGAPWRMMAIAAAVLACVGSWLMYERGGFAAAASPRLAAILRVGFGDHLHCAVIRQRNNPGAASTSCLWRSSPSSRWSRAAFPPRCGWQSRTSATSKAAGLSI